MTHYPRYDIDITLTSDGVAHVTRTIDITYGDTPTHGPQFTFITRAVSSNDDSQFRVYPVDTVTLFHQSCSSPAHNRSE